MEIGKKQRDGKDKKENTSRKKTDKKDHEKTEHKEMKRGGQMDSLVRSRFPDEPTHGL